MSSPTSSKDITEGLQFEYDQLRREILQNFVLTMQILGGTFALSGTLWSIALSTAVDDHRIKGVLFLFVWGIAIVASFRTTDLVRSTFMIAAYLRVFIEPRLANPKWETRLFQLRKVYPLGGFGTFRLTEQSTYVAIVLGSLGLAGFYIVPLSLRIFQASQSSVLPAVAITSTLFLVCLIITPWALIQTWKRYRRFEPKYDETFGSIWRQIRDQESSTDQNTGS